MRKFVSNFSALAIVLGLGAAAADAQVKSGETKDQASAQSQPAAKKKVQWHNGQWWYQTRAGKWKYWKDGEWIDLKPGSIRLTAQAGDAAAGAAASPSASAAASPKDTRGFTADNPQYAGFIKPGGGPSAWGAGPGYTKAGGPIFDGFNGPGGGYVDGTTYYVPNPNAYPAYVQPGSGAVGSDIGGVVGPPK